MIKDVTKLWIDSMKFQKNICIFRQQSGIKFLQILQFHLQAIGFFIRKLCVEQKNIQNSLMSKSVNVPICHKSQFCSIFYHNLFGKIFLLQDKKFENATKHKSVVNHFYSHASLRSFGIEKMNAFSKSIKLDCEILSRRYLLSLVWDI